MTPPLQLEVIEHRITLKCHCSVSLKFNLNLLFNVRCEVTLRQT